MAYSFGEKIMADSIITSSIGSGASYDIKWAWGQDIELAFDPLRDVLDFGWFSGNSFNVTENNGSVVISIPSNNQTYTLTGVSLSDLNPNNVITKDAQATDQWNQAFNNINLEATATAEPSTAEPSTFDPATVEPPAPVAPSTNNIASPAEISGSFKVDWAWNQTAVVAFDPSSDTIDMGWFGSDHFTVTELDGSVVIGVTSSEQTYTLPGVSLADLSMNNIVAKDASAATQWQSALMPIPAEADAAESAPESVTTPDAESDEQLMPDHSQMDMTPPTTMPTMPDHAHMHVMISKATPAQVINGFMPAMGDVIDFQSDIYAEDIAIFEESGDALGQTVRIEITNGSSVTQIVLTGFGLDALTLGNFSIANDSVLNEVAAALCTSLVGPDVNEEYTGYILTDDVDGLNPPGTTDISDTGGVRYQVDSNAGDIVGFRPGVDVLNFGGASVHGLIVTKSTAGEIVIDSPWSSTAQIVQGVTYQDVTLNDFGIVGNEHLRQDMGGVISWEQGVGPRSEDTVYLRSHEYGQSEVIEGFDPTSMKMSFLYFGTRERLTVEDTDDGMVISSLPSGQSFTFLGVSKADLIPGMVEFHFDQVMEDNLEDAFGFDQNDVSLVDRTVLLTPAAPAGATTDGFQVRVGNLTGSIYEDFTDETFNNETFTDEPAVEIDNDLLVGLNIISEDSQIGMQSSDIIDIEWSWGEQQTLLFDPQTDKLNFGWVGGDAFDLSEEQGSVVISLPANQQSYILEGVSAADMSISNIQALDATAMAEWNAFIG